MLHHDIYIIVSYTSSLSSELFNDCILAVFYHIDDISLTNLIVAHLKKRIFIIREILDEVVSKNQCSCSAVSDS